MQCRVCGAPMPAGASTCPYCGTVAISAVNQPGYNQPPPQYQQPGQPGYNQPPQYQQPGQPGYNQPPPQYQQPGQPGYNQSPPQYQQPGYNQPPPQYQQPSPSGFNQQQFDMTTVSQHPGSAFYNRAGARPQRPGMPGYGQPAGKKTPWGILIGIIALVVILGIIASLVVSSMLNPGSSNTATTNPSATSAANTPVTTASTPTTVAATPTTVAATPTATTTSPSGKSIDATAAQIVTNAQTANAVDAKSLQAPAGSVTSTFKVNDPIYVLFHLDATKFNAATETDYVNVRFYANSTSLMQDQPLQIKAYETVGYFEAKYFSATQTGAAEIYWCHTADCSDGKLAQVLHFTVTG